MKMNFTIRGSLGLGLSALLFIGCTGDDSTTVGSTATDSDSGTESTTNTTQTTQTTQTSNTTPGTTTDPSGSGSDSDSTTGNPTDPTDTDTDTATSESETDTSDPTDTDTTAGGVCGDGALDAGEECDDGEFNGTARSMCQEDCTIVQQGECGDGNQDVGEECDDGNNDDGDGCSADCKTEVVNVCGDGAVNDGEECDDGNDIPGDGCEADCTVSPPGECGNGEQEWDELCDDGNLNNGDGCEDDCTPTPEPVCLADDAYISCDGNLNKGDALAPFQALGLACSDKVSESILISNTNFASPDPAAWQIAKGFGTYQEMGKLLYSAREGESFVLLSSGEIKSPNGQGIITESAGSQTGNGATGNPDDNTFLPGYDPNDDDSGVLQPQWQKGGSNPGDKVYFSFKTKTPGGVKGYAIDFAFFSSEWPTWVDTTFNDLFVAWEVSEAFTGNISTIGDLPTTITALHPHWTDVPIGNSKTCGTFGSGGPGFSCNEPQLAGTGFEGHAATTWVRINREVAESSDLELFFFMADMGDTALASAVALDRFRFNCDECIPVDDPKCTGEVPDENCCGVVLPM